MYRKARKSMLAKENRGKALKGPIQLSDNGARYIPTPEEIEEGKAKFREQHMEKLRKANKAGQLAHANYVPRIYKVVLSHKTTSL